MIAVYDGQNYTIQLNKAKPAELDELLNKPLETSLYVKGEQDLEKTVVVQFNKSYKINNPSGIDMTFLPDKAFYRNKTSNWNDIMKIQIRLNETGYNTLKNSGSCKTNYEDSKVLEIYTSK
jgi:hypothetical protein